MKYGFIGCGNMGGALATALSKNTKDILLSDINTQKAKTLAESLGLGFGTNEQVFEHCERIFLGVKPQMMESMLSPFRNRLENKVLITMAAGLTTEQIAAFAGDAEQPVIRIMPNTPVAICKGVILYDKNNYVSDQVLQEFLSDMSSAGILHPLSEALMDAGCSLSGCGPAFMYQFIEALADGAVACGLPRDTALTLAAATMSGAAEMVLQSGKHPAQLKDEVCSPGGSTIMGVKALDDAGLRTAAMNAILASYQRNVELGK